jgi:hypothetical protein
MADYADYQIVLYHNLKGSNYELGSGGTTVPTDVDYARGSLPPRIPTGVSIKIKTKFFDDQARSKYHDFTNSTGWNLYGLPIGNAASPTLLDTGTLTGVTPANGEVLFVIPKDTIPADWASWEDKVRIWFEITDADSKLIVWQDVEIVDMQYDPDVDYPESEDIPRTNQDITGAAAVTLPAVAGGLKNVRINTTSGNYAVTLYSAAHAKAGELVCVIVAGTNTAAITPAGIETINGNSGAQNLSGIGNKMHLIPWNGNWIMLNPAPGID